MINLIENLCRTCMGEEESVYFQTPKRQTNNELFSIFNGPQQVMAYGSITIKELLKQAIPQLSIDKEDLLPKSVCKNCLDELVKIHQFQQKCLLTEQRLIDLTNDSTVLMRVMDNEDDPLTNSKIPEDFNGLHNILNIEMDEPLIGTYNPTNNDIVSKSNEISDKAGNNEQKDNSSADIEHLHSNDFKFSKMRTRNQKLASNHMLENILESRGTKNKVRSSKESLFTCKECGCSLKTPKSLKRHEKVQHGLKITQKKFKKRECQYDSIEEADVEEVPQLYSTTNAQVNHEKNNLKNSQENAEKCDVEEKILKMLDGCEEKSFACDQCGSRLKTLKSLNRHQKIHQRTHIEKEEAPDIECAWQFESEGDTEDEDFDPHDVYNNDDTNRTRRNKTEKREKHSVETDLKDYAQSDDKPYECDECGSRVKTRKSLKRHKRIHLRLPGEKAQRSKTKYECKYCQKVFSQSSSLKDHMRVHTGEKPFLCSECGKAFKILSNMKQHFLRHGTDRPYECPDCPKKFPCLTDLASHAAVHNKPKTHVCDICGSAFVKPYLLKKHKMYHTGEKNHKCDYCDMRFVLAEQCRRHMRTHTGEKPYKCKYCSRAFAQSNDLTKHLRVHLGDSVYKCDLCPQGFRLLGDLRTHFNTHKNDDDETKQRNLQALKEDELRLQLRFGLVQTTEDIS